MQVGDHRSLVFCAIRPAVRVTLTDVRFPHEALQLPGLSIRVFAVVWKPKENLVATWKELGSWTEASYLELVSSIANAASIQPERETWGGHT